MSDDEEVKLGKSLGKGQYGEVYELNDTKAAKIQRVSESDGILPHLLNENDILLNCNHKNIIKCFDARAQDVTFCNMDATSTVPVVGIITYMEKCDCSLAEWTQMNLSPNYPEATIYTKEEKIELKGRVPIMDSKEETARATIEHIQRIFCALEFLHKNHIIHGDLKFQNILLRNGIIKLVDFGLSQHIFDNQPRRSIIQTSWFRAPEVILGDPYYDERVDMWSAGVLIMKLVFNWMISVEKDNVVKIIFDFANVFGVPESASWKKLVKTCIDDNPVTPSASASASASATGHPLDALLLPTEAADRCHSFHLWIRLNLNENYRAAVELFGQDDVNSLVDLIQKCLTLDPPRRLHASEALLHPLFKKHKLIPLVNENEDECRYEKISAADPPNGHIYKHMIRNLETCCKTFGWHPNTFTIAVDMTNRLLALPYIIHSLKLKLLSPIIMCATVLILCVNYNQGEIPFDGKIIEDDILTSILVTGMRLPPDSIEQVKAFQIIFCNQLKFRMISEKCRKKLTPFVNYF
jgi:serine/threonine protein kinase